VHPIKHVPADPFCQTSLLIIGAGTYLHKIRDPLGMEKANVSAWKDVFADVVTS
jgi:hypothetical protein